MTDPYARPARPWDLFNTRLGRVETEVARERMAICAACPNLRAGVCAECHCVMALKTKLPNAVCPIGHWDQVRVLDEPPQKVVVVLDGRVVDVLNADDRMTSILLSNPTFLGVALDAEVKIGMEWT